MVAPIDPRAKSATQYPSAHAEKGMKGDVWRATEKRELCGEMEEGEEYGEVMGRETPSVAWLH